MDLVDIAKSYNVIKAFPAPGSWGRGAALTRWGARRQSLKQSKALAEAHRTWRPPPRPAGAPSGPPGWTSAGRPSGPRPAGPGSAPPPPTPLTSRQLAAGPNYRPAVNENPRAAWASRTNWGPGRGGPGGYSAMQ